MNWPTLLAEKRVTLEPTTKEEIDNLRSIVKRSINDAHVSGLSSDTRFVLAYDAARTLSLIIVRAAGYRPRSIGGHYNTFLGLAAADATFHEMSAYFDSCRTQRNHCEYDFAGGMSETDSDCLLETVEDFAKSVELWMREHHADLT